MAVPEASPGTLGPSVSHDPLVGFPGTLDATAELLTNHLVDAGRRESLGQAGDELHLLANSEFRIGHVGAPRSGAEDATRRVPSDGGGTPNTWSCGSNARTPGHAGRSLDRNERLPQAERRLPAACLPRSVTTS